MPSLIDQKNDHFAEYNYMDIPIRILIIEDSDTDRELLLHELKRGGYLVEYVCVDTSEAMNAALDLQEWDIIISDYSLPHFD